MPAASSGFLWCFVAAAYLCGARAQLLQMRRVENFLDPVFVPDFFFDLAPDAAAVLRLLSAGVPPHGGRYMSSVLDEAFPARPMMFPLLVWHTSDLWDGTQRRFALSQGRATTVYVDVGAHEWSLFFPRLRAEPDAVLICVEPTRTAFLELYRRLKMDYADLLPRVILLPVALTREANVPWGFRTMHTNDFLAGECNSLLEPDPAVTHPCAAAGEQKIVPAMSLDALLGLVLEGGAGAADWAEPGATPPVVDLKIDAQGADIEILESLRRSPALLAQVRRVQLEVSARVYAGQPPRADVLSRMHLLGFHLRWDLHEVSDGGAHPVRRGCRLVAPEPLTEDCFFRRAEAWPHTLFLDGLLRRPFEALSLSEGVDMAVSRQFSMHVRSHLDFCEEQFPRGLAYGCLAKLLGEPLGGLLTAAITAWQITPEKIVVQEVAEMLFSHVVGKSWALLTMEDWEQTHEAGAAFLLFTVLVEGLCRTHADVCAATLMTPAITRGAGGAEAGEGPGREGAGPAGCGSLRGCFRAFREMAEGPLDVVAEPARYAPLFRTAQYLSAPRCAPPDWNLELDRGAGGPFPSDRSSDGLFYVTALAADTVSCMLEVSVVVLDSSPTLVMEFQQRVWERTNQVRSLALTDVRLPTAGEDWFFDCIFPAPPGPGGQGSGRERRTAAETVSFSLLMEVPTQAGAPVLTVRCRLPETDGGGPTGGASAPGPPPHALRLVRSLRNHLEVPEFELTVPLRSFSRPRVRTALCTQQIWDYDGMEQAVPGHAEFWFRYYIDVLGVDEVYVYDLDGSFAEAPFMRELRARGHVVYDGGFSRVSPLGQVFELYGLRYSNAYFAQALAQHHCWQQARHNADWVISMNHGWDMFLFSPLGEPLPRLLARLPPDGVSYVDGVRYGSPASARGAEPEPARQANALARFPFHVDLSVCSAGSNLPEERVIIAPPQLVDGVVLSSVVPRVEASLVSNLLEPGVFMQQGPARGDAVCNSSIVDKGIWRANHYVQLFGDRVSAYDLESEQLRAFTFYDHAAVELGSRLRSGGG